MELAAESQNVPDRSTAEQLTARQARFLACLLTEPNIDLAAEKAGCGRSTAFRWLQEPAFQAAYQAAKKDAVSVATARLQASAGAMVDVLRGIAEDKTCSAPARVTAARTVIELAFKGAELEDLAGRLEELEAKLAELPDPAAAPQRTAMRYGA